MASHLSGIHERIRINYELLTTELQVSLLIDHLFGKGALTIDDVERIQAEATTQDKARRFLRIMAFRSEDMNLLFVEKLNEPGCQPHLAEAVLTTEVPDEGEEPQETAEFPGRRQMQEWSVDEVCRWLKKLDMDQKVIACFREQKISGDILFTLKKEDIIEFGPDIVYGDRIKLIKLRDVELTKLAECLFNEPETTLLVARELVNISGGGDVKSEAYQRFGCRAKASFKYTKNAQLDLDVHVPNKLLEPIHWFVGIQNDTTLNVRECLSSGAIPFICACLNERTNGTCHIGVDQDGTIRGIQATCDDVQSILKNLIDSCFYQDQLDVVRKCVQPVRLVEVTLGRSMPDKSHSDRLYIIEVDVISSYAYCTDEAFFAKIPKQNSETKETQYGDLKVLRFVDGRPQPVSGPELVKFMENKNKLAILRKKQEESKSSQRETQELSQLNEKLEHMLNTNSDVIPIFVTSPIPAEHADSDDFVNNMQFLKSIKRKVVFDFDNASLPTSLYCNHENEPAAPTRVLILHSTDEDCKDKATISTKEYLNDCYDGSTLQPWIFCNGHQPTAKKAMDVHEWKHNRRPDFLKAVEYFSEAIRPEYAVVVFLLFSNNYETMLSAAEEFCLKFPNTWMLICETKEIGYRFKEYLVKTQHIIRNEDEFDQHCVIGMPWLHVNQAILQKFSNISTGQTILPTSTGVTIPISKKLLNDLGDLEILSANHLSDSDISLEMSADKLRAVKVEKQKRFYQGEEVDWWNFWFGTHVLRRDILVTLLDSTNTTLSGFANETGERVSVIAIYHQPGSGGTTVAKNVLWDLKERYRCAVVKAITSETGDQVSRLFKEGEPSNPKSVLLLLDNFDETKVRNLKASLEGEAKTLSREVENPPPVPFVLLVCIRCSSESRASQKICHRRHNIGHNLSSRELAWFKDKYEEMEKNWSQGESLDPRVLISFNILRENFSPTYITSTIPRLVSLVTDSKEQLILKYVAFLGMYDPECQYIPASCFDCFMSNARCFDGSLAWMPSISKWTNRISDYLKVLLNEDSRTGIGLRTKGIKIIHSLISCEVYRQLVPAEVPASEVMLELLHSEMFHYEDLCSKELLKIVYSVSIKRLRRMDGQYQSDFSPLIQSIICDPKQDKGRAVEILKMAFDLTKNIFVVQHLVRFYIHVKEWKSAEEWADTMTKERPKEAVLWNTYGHVFRDQLNQRLHDHTAVTVSEAEESLGLVTKGLAKFIQEQKALDSDDSDSAGGLLGQGSIILRYIELLTRIPELQEKELHEFLLFPESVPPCLTEWTEKSVKIVKGLEKLATKIRDELESERINLQQTDILLDDESKAQNRAEQIAKTIEGIINYFGEDSNETPPNLSPQQGVYYRRRRILRLEGDRLTRILRLWHRKDFQKLEDINHLADENIKTQFRDIRDLLSCLGTGIALCMLKPQLVGMGYDPLLHLRSQSSELINLSKGTKDTSTLLEVYLCFTILNWPTPARSKNFLDIEELGNVLGKWRKAKSPAKNSQTGQEKRQLPKSTKVLLYIGVERGTERIWLEKPSDKANLEWFQGIIVNDGQQVSFDFGVPTLNNRVEIPAARISPKSNWHKSVFFALGLTRLGPLAIDISADDPHLPHGVGWQNLGTAGPMPPLIQQPNVLLPTCMSQLVHLPNNFMQPPPRYFPISPTVLNQQPMQPGYYDYARYGTPSGTLGIVNQRRPMMQHTQRSRCRGKRPRNPSDRGQ